MDRHARASLERELRDLHEELAGRIDERLAAFRRVWERGDDRELFVELVFCILTPQSGARRCARAVETLMETGGLFGGGFDEICRELNIVRFKNNKTGYILAARRAFIEGGGSLRRSLEACGSVPAMRDWLARSVKGIGYKEASHYLRNIGLGNDLAILDRHVLRALHRLGLVDAIPASLTPRIYLEMESILRAYAHSIGIPLDRLDFVFLNRATGDLFK